MDNEAMLETQVAPLLDYFQEMMPLDDSEKQLVISLFKPRLYRKRQFVLQEGDVCNQFNFVVRGCLKMYRVDEKGSIHIIQFATENWWMIDLGSFHSRNPSDVNIDALEDTMVLQISYDNLISMYMEAPKFNKIFRVLIENSFVSLQKRLLQNISSTAEDRYLSFMQTYSHLTNRLPQTLIAAFLGVSPEFLSRLRNKYAKS